MKKYVGYFICFLMVFASCSKEDDSETESAAGIDYRSEMRKFVTGISQYSKALNPGFIIIPQNGQELATTNGISSGGLAPAYLDAIDGQGREDLFYGYTGDDLSTPSTVRDDMVGFLDRMKQSGKTILVTDYCSTQSNVIDSYGQNFSKGYISFAADHRELDNIPSFPTPIFRGNANDITGLSQARNFLYLINPVYISKAQFISAVQSTNYDLVIMDLFFEEDPFSATEIESLKQKKDGGSRLILCYMSIGEAESYRFYWQANWTPGNPAWLLQENPEWPENYWVEFWNKNWQNIIYGNDQSYVKKILDAHFDGVYLDVIDAFEYFE